jgi:hypothetical protein
MSIFSPFTICPLRQEDVSACGSKDADGEEEGTLYSVSSDSEKIQDEIIERFIKNGAGLNSKDKHGLTPLHLAAMKGNTKAVAKLLSCDDIDIKVRCISFFVIVP